MMRKNAMFWKQVMRKTVKNKAVWRLLAIIILATFIPFPAKAAAKESRYLVLVQNRDHSWTAYENLTEESPQGNIMVKAKSISEAIGFSYKINKDASFTIQKSQFRKNTYVKNNTTYSFQCSSSASIGRITVYPPYSSVKNKSNLCHFKSLSTLLHCKYYSASIANDYKKAGYKGILCYSNYDAIADVPALKDVTDSSGNKFFTDTEPDENSGDDANNTDISDYSDNKLIIVGDSRTNNMSKWVLTNVNTEFICKEGQGYDWFCKTAVGEVNSIKKPGDTILIWLGVNDYNSDKLGGNPWIYYSDKINSLAAGKWKDCKVYVAEVGYVDANLIQAYYGKKLKSNVTQLSTGYKIKGIKEFNYNLKEGLNDGVTWIPTNTVIGIKGNDKAATSKNLWVTKIDGKKDGLHYGREITRKIYQYFVEKTMLPK